MLKKVLCVVLALVLSLSVMSVAGFAATASDLATALAKLPDDYNAQFYNDKTVKAIADAKAAAATASSTEEIDAAIALCDTAYDLATETALDAFDAEYYVNRDESKAILNYDISTDVSRVKPGETFNVDISIDANYYLGVLCLSFAYDTDIFEYVSVAYNTDVVGAGKIFADPNDPLGNAFNNNGSIRNAEYVPMEWYYTLPNGVPMWKQYGIVRQEFIGEVTTGVNWMPSEITKIATYTLKVKEGVTATEGKLFVDNTLRNTYFEYETDENYLKYNLFFPRMIGLNLNDSYTQMDGSVVNGTFTADYQAGYDDQTMVYSSNNGTTYTSTDIYGTTVNENGILINMAIGDEPVVSDPADYTALDKAIEDAGKVGSELYTEETLNALTTAVNAGSAIDRDLTEEDQAIINNAADEINDAINNLKYKPINTDTYVAAQETVPADLSIYTEDSVNAVNTAKAAIDAFLAGDVNITDQTDLEALVEDYEEAIAALAVKPVEPANYAELDVAILKSGDYSVEDYTSASYTRLVNAVAAGRAVRRDLTADDQGIVDAATQEILDAIEALEPKEEELKPADYKALIEALSAAKQYKNDNNYYTQASFDKLTNAILAGDAIRDDLKEDEQAIIDAAAKAINDAIADLEVVVSDVSRVKKVETCGVVRYGQIANMDVVVEGSPEKIRFVAADGVTYTLDRNHYNVTGITDNGDGTETWNVNKKADQLSESFTVYAKYEKTGWDVNGFDFTLVALEDAVDDRFVSYDIADDYEGVVYQGVHAIKVVTGVDISKVQFMVGNNTWTYSADNATYVDANGVRTWTIYLNLCNLGYNSFDIRTRTPKTMFASTGSTLDVLVYSK